MLYHRPKIPRLKVMVGRCCFIREGFPDCVLRFFWEQAKDTSMLKFWVLDKLRLLIIIRSLTFRHIIVFKFKLIISVIWNRFYLSLCNNISIINVYYLCIVVHTCLWLYLLNRRLFRGVFKIVRFRLFRRLIFALSIFNLVGLGLAYGFSSFYDF